MNYQFPSHIRFSTLKSLNLFNPSKILFPLWLFLLIFPKGGFKIGAVPITWGYLFLAICSVVIAFQKKWQIQESRSTMLLCLLPFQCVAIGTMISNGIADTGMGFSFLISFFCLPFVFFLLFSNAIENLDTERLFSLIRRGVFCIAVYGIVLFFVKGFAGFFLEIPFLTVNWGDLGELDTKHINRGTFSKLISTYNNGNIFGVCILMLTPLVNFLEKQFWRKWIIKLSLLLSLSRTVWMGLLFSEIVFHCFVRKDKKKSLTELFCFFLTAFLFIVFSFYLFGFSWGFFFDQSLGGRAEYLEISENIHLFSDRSFAGFEEIVYLGIYNQFGLVGLVTFLLAMGSPLLFILGKRKSLGPIQTSIVCGLVTYLLVACSDGALLYIPTMAFYWFCCSFGLRRDLS